MSQLNVAAITLCLSALLALGFVIRLSNGKSLATNLAGLLINTGIVILAAGEYLGLVGRAIVPPALLAVAFLVAGRVCLFRRKRKPALSGTA